MPVAIVVPQVPGEGGDFGDGVLAGRGAEGPVVMMDDIPMPSLDHSSDSMRLDPQICGR